MLLFSFHVGSGCRDATAYGVAIEHCRRLFDTGARFGHDMHLVDIGGGFPGHPTEYVSFEKVCRMVLFSDHTEIKYCLVKKRFGGR